MCNGSRSSGTCSFWSYSLSLSALRCCWRAGFVFALWLFGGSGMPPQRGPARSVCGWRAWRRTRRIEERHSQRQHEQRRASFISLSPAPKYTINAWKVAFGLKNGLNKRA